jgi:excinuclease ABC subunit A
MEKSEIRVVGAREHNLKNIDVALPRNKLVVITGLSGSGKSSLAFDTIYAEGQRRYVESLSSYARYFLGIMEKPDVDQITGLSPAISIDQKSASKNPRSTVATVTEIYDYLRLLFARVGTPHCPVCAKPVFRRSPQAIIDEILKLGGKRVYILSPLAKAKKGEFIHIPEQYQAKGFARARVDGVIYALDEWPTLDKQERHDIELVVDRLVIEPTATSRLSQSVEQALELGNGTVEVMIVDDKTLVFSTRYACVDHPDIDIPELEPRLFSFNAPFGACPTCAGLGYKMEIDPKLVLNGNLTIAEGAVRPYNRIGTEGFYLRVLRSVGQRHGFNLTTPIKQLSPAVIDMILHGTGDQQYQVALSATRSYDTSWEGIVPNLERRFLESNSDWVKKDIERYMRESECPTCHGARLKPVVLAVTIEQFNIKQVCDLSVVDALDLFQNKLEFRDSAALIADKIVKEIVARLKFMDAVGLSYLELGRAANTLSGGEAQRIRLATQIGSGLQGVLYVLDEPSIGLHQRDNQQLIVTLKNLRDLGNTVLVVEHDEETIRSADWLIDIGPEAGLKGGRVVAEGTPAQVAANPKSLTGQYLSGKKSIVVPKKRRSPSERQLVVRGASQYNLKSIDVSFPLGLLNVVTGVSGSGKSTLVNDILAKELSARLNRAKTVSGQHDGIDGIELLDKVVIIDQSPIGRTPRSNPATYTGIFTKIRELFAATPEANIRGYKSGRFSFNVRGGRCENCQGEGVLKVEMHFLPDVFVTCPVCAGKRYNREALEITYKTKTIADVLDMTVDEAYELFEPIPAIAKKLKTIQEVGLGYIKLGQAATTFSGGEAQRIKLATELSRPATGKTLYILDEPTTGLHADDVKKLIGILNRLVEAGNSVIVIEHNLDVIKSADNIIDLGPDGGQNGGRIMAEGTPEEVARVAGSYTGQYLKKVL